MLIVRRDEIEQLGPQFLQLQESDTHLLVETKFTSFRELGLLEPNARDAYPALPVTARIGKDGETSMLVHASPCLPLSGVYSINLAYVGTTLWHHYPVPYWAFGA